MESVLIFHLEYVEIYNYRDSYVYDVCMYICDPVCKTLEHLTYKRF